MAENSLALDRVIQRCTIDFSSKGDAIFSVTRTMQLQLDWDNMTFVFTSH